MRYKVGDCVRIKSLDWYNENKSKSHGTVACGSKYFDYDMKEWCGKTMTILTAYQTCYIMQEDGAKDLWTDEMIEGLVEEEKSLYEGCCSLELKYNKLIIADNICTDEVEIILQDYELKQKGDKWFAIKKKKKYPKTYCECKDTLGLWDIDDTERGYYKTDLIDKLQMLLICRDAYWKIAGEEMGLGKPWKPDWDNVSDKYCIYFVSGYAWSKECQTRQCPFAFPTPEMRDAFYENFKEEIEICKELL